MNIMPHDIRPSSTRNQTRLSGKKVEAATFAPLSTNKDCPSCPNSLRAVIHDKNSASSQLMGSEPTKGSKEKDNPQRSRKIELRFGELVPFSYSVGLNGSTAVSRAVGRTCFAWKRGYTRLLSCKNGRSMAPFLGRIL